MRRSDDEESSPFVFVVSLVLLATGLLALPAGVVLLIAGEWKHGALCLAYGIVNACVAMFGSSGDVLLSTFGVSRIRRKK